MFQDGGEQVSLEPRCQSLLHFSVSFVVSRDTKLQTRTLTDKVASYCIYPRKLTFAVYVTADEQS